ncbi:hypothetical protein P7C70_g7406, partial [Phenoliferia sp. Uapishka_3]
MSPPPYEGPDLPYEPPKERDGALLSSQNDAGAAFEVPPLPPGAPRVGVEKCYTDMIRYLYDHSKAWFLDNTPDGDKTWDRLGDKLKLVVAHPNGWTQQEQSVLRNAVVNAGLMMSNAKVDRLRLVTEAEASVHFGIVHAAGSKDGWLEPGSSFAVVDAGGSTVDTCVYTVQSSTPKLILREAGVSACIQCGAIFVTRAMRSILAAKLAPSKQFNTQEILDILEADFEKKVKLKFDAVDENYILQLGRADDNDVSVGISRGRLKVTGLEVEQAFAPGVDMIIKSIKDQIKKVKVTHILIVGVVTVDEPTQKAVAEGAAIHYAQDHVGARATRFEYGLCTNRLVFLPVLQASVLKACDFRRYTPDIPSSRSIIVFNNGEISAPIILFYVSSSVAHVFLNAGKKFFSGGWTKIVGQGVVIETNQIFKEKFWVHKKRNDSLEFTTTLYSFNGPDATARYDGWSADENGRLYPGFAESCTITADLTTLALATAIEQTSKGEKYRELDFEVGLLFGGTE